MLIHTKPDSEQIAAYQKWFGYVTPEQCLNEALRIEAELKKYSSADLGGMLLRRDMARLLAYAEMLEKRNATAAWDVRRRQPGCLPHFVHTGKLGTRMRLLPAWSS